MTILEELAIEYECKPTELFKDLLDLNGIDRVVNIQSIEEARELITTKSPIGKAIDEKTYLMKFMKMINKTGSTFY